MGAKSSFLFDEFVKFVHFFNFENLFYALNFFYLKWNKLELNRMEEEFFDLIRPRKRNCLKALEFVKQIDLNKYWDVTKIEICLTPDVRYWGGQTISQTVGTAALIYLFDPTNGWDRDGSARPYIIDLASYITEQSNVQLEGIVWGANTDYHQSVLDIIKRLVQDPLRYGYPPYYNKDMYLRFKYKDYDIPLNTDKDIQDKVNEFLKEFSIQNFLVFPIDTP